MSSRAALSASCTLAMAYSPLSLLCSATFPHKIMSGNEQACRQNLHNLYDKLDAHAIASVLQTRISLSDGKSVHSRVVEVGFEENGILSNALIGMYCDHGAVIDARKLFDKMLDRSPVSWASMITAYTKQGYGEEALDLFRSMQHAGVKPNKISFMSLLHMCTSLAALAQGKILHACIIESGFESDVIVGTALVNMYGKCGAAENARSLFWRMPQHDVVSWNAIITVNSQQKHGSKAIQFFREMQQSGVHPNRVTYIGVLGACASVASLAEGKWIHGLVTVSGFESDVVVGNALVNMYSKCEAFEDALCVFHNMDQRTVVSWTTMIDACAHQGQGKEALLLLREMLEDGVKPNQATFVSTISACASLGELPEGEMIHAYVVDGGFESDIVVGTALVNMYHKCGVLGHARLLFSKMHQRNVVSWTALITACTQHGDVEGALQLYKQMQEQGFKPDEILFSSILSACAQLAAPGKGRVIHATIVDCGLEVDIAVGNTLINMYGKCGSLEDAQLMFDRMHLHNVISWNAIISVCTQQVDGKKALEYFQLMQQDGEMPSDITYISILRACASLAALSVGEMIHKCIITDGMESDVGVTNGLVNMYGKCGALSAARSVFDTMQCRDIVSCNTMIAAYAQQGCGKEAVQIFEHMRQEAIKPDEATFVSLLTACSHEGLVKEGSCCFLLMTEHYGISPTLEHYTCMIDLLGRVGKLDEAEDFIHEMPVQPDACAWTTFLSACRMYNDVERGMRAAEHILDLEPQGAGPYVLLSNMYSAEGRWSDLQNLRLAVSERSVEKQSGCSLIKIGNTVHQFLAMDRKKHPEIEAIHRELECLSRIMEEAGYLPEINSLLESEGYILLHHSEKLAIALGLVNTSPGTSIHVFKNFRMCIECHTAVKFISKIVGREIMIDDTNQFHCFKHGVCSCGNYSGGGSNEPLSLK